MPRKLLQIAQLGQPALRTKAQEVKDPCAPEVQELVDDMLATCEDVDGMGLAAPQVYQSLRVFIMASKPNARYPNAPTMEPVALINPELLSFIDQKEISWEGCLSIPGLRGKVPRYTTVNVAFLDREGVEQRRTFEGFLARVFQHELDHLNGVLFVDRANSENLATEREYQRIIQQEVSKK